MHAIIGWGVVGYMIQYQHNWLVHDRYYHAGCVGGFVLSLSTVNRTMAITNNQAHSLQVKFSLLYRMGK